MKHWTPLSAALSLAFCILVWYMEVFTNLETDPHSAVSLFAQISATMLGFLIAALSVLASISGHRLVIRMRETGHYRVLLRRFFINSSAYAAAMITAIIAFLFKSAQPTSGFIALFFFVFANILLVDIGWRLWLVLHNLSPTTRD